MRLLIVEDEENISSYLKASLKAEGFDVDVASDGITGLQLALSNRYDAITLDIMLPGINGYKVCHEIRQAGLETPILMLTAKNGEYDEADALDIGADDFLSKPFSLVVLVARIRALLRRKGQSSSRILEIAGIQLDTARRTVKRQGQPIELTPREFALLEYLMLNQNQVLTKAAILGHVWDSSVMSDENVIEVYIGYLRKKVDAPFGRKSIRTVRGVGYKIVDEEA